MGSWSNQGTQFTISVNKFKKYILLNIQIKLWTRSKTTLGFLYFWLKCSKIFYSCNFYFLSLLFELYVRTSCNPWDPCNKKPTLSWSARPVCTSHPRRSCVKCFWGTWRRSWGLLSDSRSWRGLYRSHGHFSLDLCV